MLILVAQKKKKEIERYDRMGYKFAHLPFRIKFPAFFHKEYSKER